MRNTGGNNRLLRFSSSAFVVLTRGLIVMLAKYEILTPSSGEKSVEKFDVKQVSAWVYKSVSQETRRSYKRVVKEFFGFVGNIQPSQIEPEHVRQFRDWLIQKGRRPATVTFKRKRSGGVKRSTSTPPERNSSVGKKKPKQLFTH